MMSWDKEGYIKSLGPVVDKFIQWCYSKNLSIGWDGHPNNENNVVFFTKDKELVMSLHSLYRFSGRAVVYKDRGEQFIEAVELTYEGYLNTVIKPIIERHFAA